mgnify:CR=1 FL=1
MFKPKPTLKFLVAWLAIKEFILRQLQICYKIGKLRPNSKLPIESQKKVMRYSRFSQKMLHSQNKLFVIEISIYEKI